MSATQALDNQPEIFTELSVTTILEQLRNRGDADPVESVAEGRDRQIIAQVLFAEFEPATAEQVAAAIQPLHHHYLTRRQRELRALIAETERKSDWGKVAELTNEKMRLDRQLRDLGH